MTLAEFVWLLVAVSVAAAATTAGSLSSVLGEQPSLLQTGTTIVGVCCRDGVVLGADTRSTGGPLVMDKNKLKIHTVAPRIFCCAAGTSADCDQLTRRAGHYLSLLRIEHDLAGDGGVNYLDSVSAAIASLIHSMQHAHAGRLPESSIILGGLDANGPALYQLAATGASRTSFCALGSGSVDAISVLEAARSKWGKTQSTRSVDGIEGADRSIENINVEDAIDAVRQAVRAGILNDLGSGSHVDLCVIKREGVTRWRERLVFGFDQEERCYSTSKTPPMSILDTTPSNSHTKRQAIEVDFI